MKSSLLFIFFGGAFLKLVAGEVNAAAVCTGQLQTLGDCLTANGSSLINNGQACDECRLEAISAFETDSDQTCADASRIFCGDNCQEVCGSTTCLANLEDYFVCLVESSSGGTCRLNCDVDCQAEFQQYGSCVTTSLSDVDAQNCDACRLQAEQNLRAGSAADLDSCSNQNSVLCEAARRTCQGACQNCVGALEQYWTCETSKVSCPLSCDCPSALDGYLNCVFRLDSASGMECEACREQTETQFVSSGGTCAETKDLICTAVNNTCQPACQDCDDELERYIACNVLKSSDYTCEIDCGTELTIVDVTKPLCDEFNVYADCVANQLPVEQGRTCDACRLEATLAASQALSCEAISDIYCQVDDLCGDCGTCTSILQDFLICNTSVRTFGACQVECPLPPTPSPSMSPITTAPTTTPPITTAPTKTPTQAPVTESPTQAPVTAAPTQAPASAAPTQAPMTAAPAQAPMTAAPTQAPVSEAPTSPITAQPSTKAPIKATDAPVTPAPTTNSPVTSSPTTVAPSIQLSRDVDTNAPTKSNGIHYLVMKPWIIYISLASGFLLF